MKIAIVGAGSLGSVFSCLLHKAGEDVWLVHHISSLVRRINERGITLSMGKEDEVYWPRATYSPADVGKADLVLFLTKSYDLDLAAYQAISMVGQGTYAMTLQNGIGNVEAIIGALDMNRVIYGTTTVGAYVKKPGHVVVDVPLGQKIDTYIGEWNKQKSDMLLNVCDVFNRAGIRTEAPDNIEQLVWRKLAMAAGTGMITAIVRLKAGDLIDQQEGKELVSLMIGEIVEIANKKGIELDAGDILKHILAVAHEHREHRSSMLMTILNKKRTEVDSLSGAVVREAEKLGLCAPTNRAVALLVKIIEKTYDRLV